MFPAPVYEVILTSNSIFQILHIITLRSQEVKMGRIDMKLKLWLANVSCKFKKLVLRQLKIVLSKIFQIAQKLFWS